MSTSNRERLKYTKVLNETCKLINAHTDQLRAARGGTVGDQTMAAGTWNGQSTFLTEDVQNVHAHPSYRLYEEGIRIAGRRPHHAVALWEKALTFAQSLSQHAGAQLKLKIYEAIVSVSLQLKKYEQAADLMEAHLDLIRESTSDRTVEVRVLNQLGKTHFLMGNYEESETCHALQQSLAHQIFDHSGEMTAFYGQGVSLYAEYFFEEAKEMFKKYLASAEEFSEEKDIAVACGKLGLVHYDLEEYSDAFVSFKKQISQLRDMLSVTPADKSTITNLCQAFGNLANVYRKWDKLPLCFNALNKALKLARDLGIEKLEGGARYSLASVILMMRTKIELQQNPTVYYGGAEEEKMLDGYIWSCSQWSGHKKIVDMFLEGGAGEEGGGGPREIFNEILRHLDFCLASKSSGSELLWNCLCDYGTVMFLTGKPEEGAGFYAKCGDLLVEVEEDYDEKGVAMPDDIDEKIASKRLQICLFEGMFRLMYSDWEGAMEKLELVTGELAKSGDSLKQLAAAKCMVGWCLVKVGRSEEARKVFESSLKCFDILRDYVGMCTLRLSLGDLWKDEGKTKGMGSAWGMDWYGKCFALAGEQELLEFQIGALEKLSDVHNFEGDCEISTDLAKRGYNLRALLEDNEGLTEAEAKLALKTTQSIENAVVWCDAEEIAGEVLAHTM
jgi:tetratricopeptide (TPR) repeat protein